MATGLVKKQWPAGTGLHVNWLGRGCSSGLAEQMGESEVVAVAERSRKKEEEN